MDTRIEHTTLSEKAYAKIRAGLMSAEFGPGESLRIRPLAEHYGISATPVREALQRLVAENVLEIQPNKSFRVPVLTADRFEEIVRMRIALEPLASELAFENIGNSELRELGKLVEIMDRAITNVNIRSYTAANEKFHFMIYDKSNAQLLLGTIRDLWVLAAPYFSMLFDETSYTAEGNKLHYEIMRALHARDSESLCLGIRKDIELAYTDLVVKFK